MTDLLERPLDGSGLDATELPELPDLPTDDAVEERSLRVNVVAIAATLSGLAPAWLMARLFRGGIAPVIATVAGVAVGAVVTWLSYRTKRPSAVQCLVIPAAAIVGALLVLPSTGGGASLPSLVSEALRAGGLRQAPVAFDPGWRFLCVLITAVTTAAAFAVAMTFTRPQLVVVVPLPMTIGAALLQPKGAEVASGAVAMVFVIGSLLVGYGAELGSEGDVGARFESRRLLRGGALMLGVIVALVVLAQTNFLFPATNRSDVIPPRKPPPPIALPEKVLFTVRSDQPGPWRVGTLDGYGQNAFLLPPDDPHRAKVIPKNGVVDPTPGGVSFTAMFSIGALPGHTLPTPAGTVAVTGAKHTLQYDPRTNDVELRDTSIPPHLTYSVRAQLPPDSRHLSTAAPPDRAILSEFTAAPPPPPAVRALLGSIPPTTDAFDRLQAVRQALYNKVIVAGAGKAGDIPPDRVAAMLGGAQASPYEITAAQVLLARWAGIPARLGYGFYGGTRAGDTVSFRPEDGAAWLEAYFQGYGWVPIVGTPPRAKPSISPAKKKNNPRVVATDQLAITVYVPVRSPSYRLLFEIVRYWLTIVTPFAILVVALLLGYPAAIKRVRSGRRRRWALARGPTARVAVAYAELRDLAHDFNIGEPRATPLEFVDAVAVDDEHLELAWLVTRTLWADLARDLRIEDVEAAEEMAASVRRRLGRDQTGINRLLAAVARASLRDPWTDEIPNRWRGAARRELPAPGSPPPPDPLEPPPPPRSPGRGRRRKQLAGVAAAVVVATGCSAAGASPAVRAGDAYPPRIAPATIATYTLTRESKLETDYAKAKGDALVSGGRVWAVRDGDTIEGTVQVALFRPGVDIHQRAVQNQVEAGLSAAGAVTDHIGLIRLRALTLPEQQVFVWFPPDHDVMELFIMRQSFRDALPVVEAILAYQTGIPIPGAAA